MAKKEPTHNKFEVLGNTVSKDEVTGKGEQVEIIIPKDMPYVKVRKALEIALLRIR